MSKYLTRIVSLIWVSCLMCDSALAGHFPIRQLGNRSLNLFTEQAIIPRNIVSPRHDDPEVYFYRAGVTGLLWQPGAQHSKGVPWFPILLKRMGFMKLQELENDPHFQSVIKTMGIPGGIKIGVFLFGRWERGRPDERLTESVALAFSLYSRKKVEHHGQVAPDLQIKALERLAPFLERQLSEHHQIEMKEGPWRLQVLANPETAWRRNLVFEVVDSQDKEPSGAHYFPLLKTGHKPAYVIQIQLRDIGIANRLMEIIDHELLETAWRAVGCPEKEADEYARERHWPSPGTHRGTAEVPGQPGMEHNPDGPPEEEPSIEQIKAREASKKNMRSLKNLQERGDFRPSQIRRLAAGLDMSVAEMVSRRRTGRAA